MSQTRDVDAVFEVVTLKTYNYAVKSKDTLKKDFHEPEKYSITKRTLFLIFSYTKKIL